MLDNSRFDCLHTRNACQVSSHAGDAQLCGELEVRVHAILANGGRDFDRMCTHNAYQGWSQQHGLPCTAGHELRARANAIFLGTCELNEPDAWHAKAGQSLLELARAHAMLGQGRS